MHSKWVFKHFRAQSNKQCCLMAFLWGAGLLFGILLCILSPYETTDILYGVIGTKPSLLSLLLVCMLPVVLSAIAVCSPLFPIAYILVFLSAVSHGFCGTVIYLAVGDAAWLLRPIFLFSASCSSVLMWWLLFQANTGERLHKHIGFALCLSSLVYIIDLFLISPLVGDIAKVL